MAERFFITGGAGFIGSHFTDHLLDLATTERVTVFDNFSSGDRRYLEHRRTDPRLRIVPGDLKDPDALAAAIEGHEVVIHLASNPDIARAATEPSVDFDEGTLLTHRVLEAMRTAREPRTILYASGSGVYGDLGEKEVHEDHGPLVPISTYGASKLAGEGLISAYCHMFDMRACVFRFANVVGPRQTHGVGLDFLRKLTADPERLPILGDGTQSKSYIHVSDVISAVMLASRETRGRYGAYNVATSDHVTVREIADMVVEALGRSPAETRYEFSGGSRGWKGDVPVVRLDTERIRALGWAPTLSSRDALRSSIRELRDGLVRGDA